MITCGWTPIIAAFAIALVFASAAAPGDSSDDGSPSATDGAGGFAGVVADAVGAPIADMISERNGPGDAKSLDEALGKSTELGTRPGMERALSRREILGAYPTWTYPYCSYDSRIPLSLA
jgi:hypothetical protein